MAHRGKGQLDTPAAEEGVGGNEKGAGPFAYNRREGCIDLAACAGADDMNLQSHSDGGRFDVSQCCLGNHYIGRIDEHSHASACGHQFAQELQLLRRQLAIDKIDTC